MVLGQLIVASSIVFLAVSLILSGENTFRDYRLPPPPQLVGALRPKLVKGAERVAGGIAPGPESLVVEKGTIYTCLADGRCVKIVNNNKVQKTVRLIKHAGCDGTTSTQAYCGRPLGLRRRDANTFLVVDSSLGIYSVDFEKERSELVFSARNKVAGTAQGFPDDFDFVDNDTVVYSDASARGSSTLVPVLLPNDDGRLIKLKLSTGEAEVLADGLYFPNGVQAHPDKQSVLAAESTAGRVLRVFFVGPKKGRIEVFADNLPGLPDNIRLAADRKSFYVAFFTLRLDTHLFVDYLAPKAWLRNALSKVAPFVPENLLIRFMSPPSTYGIAVELDLNGNIVNTYHDPEGKAIFQNTQVTDGGDKYLYFGSYTNNWIGRVLKH